MPAVKRGGRPPAASDGSKPKSARRAGTQGRGQPRTRARMPRAARSRTARAARARSASRSARSSTPETAPPASASNGRNRAGGRWTTATESRAKGSAARIASSSSGSSPTARWQVWPREADRWPGRCVASLCSSSRAATEATSAGRGGPPPTSIRSPARSGPDPAQARAAAATLDPLAAPTRVTRTTALIAGASRRPCW